MHIYNLPTDANPDEAAAALAAVACFLEQSADSSDMPRRGAWSSAAALAVQRLPAAQNGAHASWGQAERSRRAAAWSSGIVGL